MSRTRSHWQMREDNGSGRKRRLHNHTRHGCGSMRVARLVGNAVSAAEANGPCCDLINARVCQGGPSSLAQTFQQCCPCRTLPAALHWLSYPGRPPLFETFENFVQQPEKTRMRLLRHGDRVKAPRFDENTSRCLHHGSADPSRRSSTWLKHNTTR